MLPARQAPEQPPTPGRLLPAFPALQPLREHPKRRGGGFANFPAGGGPVHVPVSVPLRLPDGASLAEPRPGPAEGAALRPALVYY